MGKLDIIHVIDDDEAIRNSIDLLLTADGFVVETYASALEFLKAGPPDNEGCVLTDLQMPDMTGMDLVSEISLRRLSWPVILMSAQATAPLRDKAKALGVTDFLTKPFPPEALAAAVRYALKSRQVAGIEASHKRYHSARFACR